MALLPKVPILYSVAGLLAVLAWWSQDVRAFFLAVVCLVAGFLQDVRSGRLGSDRPDDRSPR